MCAVYILLCVSIVLWIALLLTTHNLLWLVTGDVIGVQAVALALQQICEVPRVNAVYDLLTFIILS